ncbi:MAG: YihY/virulence factor BrkB family protein [Ginsengibacter sp.]
MSKKKTGIFSNIRLLGNLKEKSKHWYPPGFQNLSVHTVLRHFFKQFHIPDISEKAAAIAYNFIMSIPPTLLFLFTLIPNLPFISKTVLKNELHALIYNIIPSTVYNTGVIDFVDSLLEGSKFGLISFTFILSLFFASNAVIGIMRAFNKDYVGFETIKGLKKRWEAIKLTLMLFGLLLTYFFLLLLQSNILNWMGIEDSTIKELILIGKWILIVALIFNTFAFIYRYAPSTTKRWKIISPGAIIATLLSIGVTIGFTSFVNNFGRYNLLYGSIGTIMVIMVMIFLNSLVVLVGFEFNLSIHTLKSEEEEKISTSDFKKKEKN